MKGNTPEKRIFVHMEDLEEKKKREEEIKADRERVNERMDALKGARTPWFCPNCKKVMNKRLDDKMYRIYNQCFDCQVKFENKLRIDGKYEEWEEKKVLNNQLSYIRDQIESIEDWKKEASKPLEVFDQVGVKDIELQTEKWSQNTEKVEEMSNEALEELDKMKTEVEEKLNSLTI
jgi:DNA-binding transcriptional MerR regulator